MAILLKPLLSFLVTAAWPHSFTIPPGSLPKSSPSSTLFTSGLYLPRQAGKTLTQQRSGSYTLREAEQWKGRRGGDTFICWWSFLTEYGHYSGGSYAHSIFSFNPHTDLEVGHWEAYRAKKCWGQNLNSGNLYLEVILLHAISRQDYRPGGLWAPSFSLMVLWGFSWGMTGSPYWPSFGLELEEAWNSWKILGWKYMRGEALMKYTGESQKSRVLRRDVLSQSECMWV